MNRTQRPRESRSESPSKSKNKNQYFAGCVQSLLDCARLLQLYDPFLNSICRELVCGCWTLQNRVLSAPSSSLEDSLNGTPQTLANNFRLLSDHLLVLLGLHQTGDAFGRRRCIPPRLLGGQSTSPVFVACVCVCGAASC
eukprot:gnl/Hemi2/12754_TR4359_c0_g1_i1.p1 gnl/Hemi2/12754_TR4359_c0_g1~~gnl/Hemi2/12754_TR4359_c0_g1_i1.p1  ORF type:complete len:140 (+),score=14.48 gnl/Hemi2/12754_TR4359_c0_g1_i1:119-538(+)